MFSKLLASVCLDCWEHMLNKPDKCTNCGSLRVKWFKLKFTSAWYNKLMVNK